MDIRLHYTEAGAGFPLVLLHGNGESGVYFTRQIPFFAQYRRVIAVDTRGHGQSPRGNAPFCLGTFTDDLRALITELGIGEFDLLGFSDGGNIALTFVLKYPGLVRRLVLNGANLHPLGLKASCLLPVVAGYGLSAILSPVSAAARHRRALLGLMVREPRLKAAHLRGIPIPTLVIAGRRDVIRSRHTAEIADALPRGALTLISGNHFCAAQNSAAFNAAVFAFLGP